MTTESDDATVTGVYALTCTDCPFETTVQGTYRDALDVADTHQEEHGDSLTDHFVNLRLDGNVE